VFSLVDPNWVSEAVREDPAAISLSARHGLERALDLAAWLDIYRPQIVLSARATSATAHPRQAA
jgi:asparagine synthase (glutamine-hydrolysing)